ncbi:hypothetical protein FSS13T_20430 [Flavobacterium saliperosum S13]|nr:hypothetical protein FSS13T_20430 [Flavobacterium saliperosum S13]
MLCPTIKNTIDMKTNYLSGRNVSIYTIFGLVGLLASSCGSYQNASYYDNDGVYGSSERPRTQTENKYSEENLEQSNKYKDFFAANKDNYSYDNEAFTDIEGYNSQSNDTVAKNQQDNYAGWGDNDKNVTINYYNNDYWGWNSPYYGWGWNSWYSPSWSWGWNSYYGNYWNVGFGWGWNSPYYGWGWNSWYSPYYSGYYYPYNGYYGHHHHYIGGTRGGYSYQGNRGRSYSNQGIYSGGRGNTINNPRPRSSNFTNPRTPNFNNPRNNNSTVNPRNNNTVNPRNNNVNPRNNNVNPRGTQYQEPTPRPRVNPSSEPKPRSSEYSAPRNNNYSAPRSNNSYSTPRSSGSSFGGGGNSGGGRSGGGGRR